MGNKSPAFQFYAAEYLADEKVQLLTIAQEGAYIRLLAYCWREGSIPSDENELSILCKGLDGQAISQVISLFKRHPKRSDRLVHKRLEVERQKKSDFRKKMSDSGKIGAFHRWKKNGQAIARPMASDSSSSSSSSSSSNKKNKPYSPFKKGHSKASSYTLEFEEFWKAYPNRKGKFQAFKAWNKLNPDQELQTKMTYTVKLQSSSLSWQKDDGKYIPHAATWLNNRRWEDEIELPKEQPNYDYQMLKTIP